MAAHSPFSHVDLVLPEGLLGASDQGADSPCISGNPCGVAIRPNNYQRFGTRRNAVIDTGPSTQPIIDIAKAQLGKPFDGDALYAFASDKLDRDWEEDDAWFCSELIGFAFEKSGFWRRPLMWPKNRLSPTDLLLILSMSPLFVNRDEFWLPENELR